MKCKEDPVYFAKNYCKIVSLDEGLVPFKLYDFQEDMVRRFHANRFNIAKLPRQTGKSTTVVAYLMHYALFNDNVNIGILANKAPTARELLGRLQLAYENLPVWLQQGIIAWNKGSMELENGSKILASSTSASAVRGMSFNIIFLDEFAFIPNHVAEQFFASVYPTISSGKSTKVIIISTPNGMNMFYKLWHDAELEVETNMLPQKFTGLKFLVGMRTGKNKRLLTHLRQFTQEFECEFLGSVDTLISATKLRSMSYCYDEPLSSSKRIKTYTRILLEGHEYFMTVDVARGTNNDYSAFILYDITTVPYKVVGVYKNNQIKPMLFPNIIHQVSLNYNKAFVLCEVNDIGDQVASILQYDLENEKSIDVCYERSCWSISWSRIFWI